MEREVSSSTPSDRAAPSDCATSSRCSHSKRTPLRRDRRKVRRAHGTFTSPRRTRGRVRDRLRRRRGERTPDGRLALRRAIRERRRRRVAQVVRSAARDRRRRRGRAVLRPRQGAAGRRGGGRGDGDRARVRLDPSGRRACRKRHRGGATALAHRFAGPRRPPARGSVSGVAHVSGNLDDFQPDAGFIARAELDLAGTRARAVALPNSHLDVTMTQRMPQLKRALGRTRCGGQIAPPFDKQAYLADASSRGEWTVNGNLLGDTVRLGDVVVTRAKASHLAGRLSLRALDLGLLDRVLRPPKSDSDGLIARPPVHRDRGPGLGRAHRRRHPARRPRRIPREAGRRTDVSHPSRAEDYPQDAPRPARPRRRHPHRIPRSEMATASTPTRAPGRPGRSIPDSRGGFCVLTGAVRRVSTDPTLELDARLDPVDLAVLPRLLPRVDRASGHVEGSLRVTGRAAAPTLVGELHAAADDIDVHSLPSALTDVKVDVRANTGELSASGSAKFAGGPPRSTRQSPCGA